jgi:hypothetical protein
MMAARLARTCNQLLITIMGNRGAHTKKGPAAKRAGYCAHLSFVNLSSNICRPLRRELFRFRTRIEIGIQHVMDTRGDGALDQSLKGRGMRCIKDHLAFVIWVSLEANTLPQIFSRAGRKWADWGCGGNSGVCGSIQGKVRPDFRTTRARGP